MERFLKIFEVPDAAKAVIDKIVNKDEIKLLEAVGRGSFTSADAANALERKSTPLSPDRLNKLLLSAYKRGIIMLQDESFTKFQTATFYGRLDIFAITEHEKYMSFPIETRKALDKWYFDAYLNGLGNKPRPTGDRVITLNEAFEFIDKTDKQIWLNKCDCRTIAGNCEKPVETCLTLKSGINTMSHRGWSKPLTKAEAKEIVKKAHKAGLMQTVNSKGMCNCCGDCCYLFRAQMVRSSIKVWPQSDYIASFDDSTCIACGRCVKRCNFGAFTKGSNGITYNSELCRGCGLCATTCPKSAIILKRRNQNENGG